jgi:hypothetical protein
MSDALCDIHDRRDTRGQCSCSLIVSELRAEVVKLKAEKAMLAETMNEAVKRYLADEKENERMRPVYEIACGRWRTGHAAQVGSWPFQQALAAAVDAALASETKPPFNGSPHHFVGEHDCEICGEGYCHYHHAPNHASEAKEPK